MTDNVLINAATALIGLFAATTAFSLVVQVLTAVGLPGSLGVLVGAAAAVGAFLAVLYGYYLVFLEDEDDPASERPDAGTTDRDVVGTRSYRK